MKIKFRKVVTFNCQGLNSAVKQQQIADDFIQHNLSIMMVQETRIKGNQIINLTSSDNQILYLYNSGNESKSIHGTGIIVRPNVNIKYKPISDRICMISMQDDKKITCNFISAYTPTLDKTTKNPNKYYL